MVHRRFAAPTYRHRHFFLQLQVLGRSISKRYTIIINTLGESSCRYEYLILAACAVVIRIFQAVHAELVGTAGNKRIYIAGNFVAMLIVCSFGEGIAVQAAALLETVQDLRYGSERPDCAACGGCPGKNGVPGE